MTIGFVEPEADLFVLGADRLAVVRHHLAGAGRDRFFERLQVQLELSAGIDLVAPVAPVRVFTVLLRTAAGEVLRHGRDRTDAERLTLEATDVGGGKATGQLGILTERRGLTRPARLGREVDLRVQCDTQTHRRVLLPCDVGEALDELLVADCGETDRLGPLREGTGHDRGPRVVAERIARIRRERHRDAEARRRGGPLQCVVPFGELTGLGGGSHDAEVRHVPAVNVITGGRREGGFAVDVGCGDRREEEQAGLLFDRHLGEQTARCGAPR